MGVTHRYRGVRTEVSLPLPTGMGQMKQGIFNELRWRGGRTPASQGHGRPLGDSVGRGLAWAWPQRTGLKS